MAIRLNLMGAYDNHWEFQVYVNNSKHAFILAHEQYSTYPRVSQTFCWSIEEASVILNKQLPTRVIHFEHCCFIWSLISGYVSISIYKLLLAISLLDSLLDKFYRYLDNYVITEKLPAKLFKCFATCLFYCGWSSLKLYACLKEQSLNL